MCVGRWKDFSATLKTLLLKKKSLSEGLGGLDNQVPLHKDLPLFNPAWRTSKEPEPLRTKMGLRKPLANLAPPEC